jgi:hypothetical protein
MIPVAPAIGYALVVGVPAALEFLGVESESYKNCIEVVSVEECRQAGSSLLTGIKLGAAFLGGLFLHVAKPFGLFRKK